MNKCIYVNSIDMTSIERMTGWRGVVIGVRYESIGKKERQVEQLDQ